MRNFATSLLVLALVLTTTPPLEAQNRRGRPAPAEGVTNLPHVVADSEGNQWVIQRMGWLQQQGNMPIFNQGGMLLINQNQPNQENNQARIDGKTGEIILENMPVGGVGVSVTRRILINKEESYVRYIDVLRNDQAQEQSFTVTIQSNLMYGVNAAQTLPDPKEKNQNYAWIGQTGAGRSVVQMFAGKGAKLAPTINWPQGNSYVQAMMPVTIPPKKEVAIMHLHATAATQEQGAKFASAIRESKLMASLPPELRRIIINFPTGASFAGDLELLRGEVFDVVELRSGDRVQGTLTDASFPLQTFYGSVELKAERVLGMLNIGSFRPRQLIVTTDGEVYGGYLAKDQIGLKLSSGQETQIPLAQVSRVGYRKRPGESDELPEPVSGDRTVVVLRSGDRIAVTLPQETVKVLTRYGLLELKPQQIAGIVFQDEEQPVHRVHLIDGSRFAALVTQEQLQLTLASGAATQPVSVPTSSISRLQSKAELPEPDDASPMLQLTNGDLFVGTLSGELQLDAAFDTIAIDAGEVRALTRLADAISEVQITLWDESTVSGQLRQPQLRCALSSGVELNVPLVLVQSYTQPLPQPTADMVGRIETIVGQLSAEDWKQRDRAETQLISMGSMVIPVLKRMQPTQPAEAQQRISHVLQQLGEREATAAPALRPMPAN